MLKKILQPSSTPNHQIKTQGVAQASTPSGSHSGGPASLGYDTRIVIQISFLSQHYPNLPYASPLPILRHPSVAPLACQSWRTPGRTVPFPHLMEHGGGRCGGGGEEAQGGGTPMQGALSLALVALWPFSYLCTHWDGEILLHGHHGSPKLGSCLFPPTPANAIKPFQVW